MNFTNNKKETPVSFFAFQNCSLGEASFPATTCLEAITEESIPGVYHMQWGESALLEGLYPYKNLLLASLWKKLDIVEFLTPSCKGLSITLGAQHE